MLVYDTDAIYVFLKSRTPGLLRVEGGMAIGWVRDGVLSAGVVFENHNGRTVWAHVALDKPLPFEFPRAFLVCPFKVCEIDLVRGYVLASNIEINALVFRSGASSESVLKNAASKGKDVSIFLPKAARTDRDSISGYEILTYFCSPLLL